MLAAQLGALTVPRRSHASLLFARGEAGDYDARTIYHLGVSGLDVLVRDHGGGELEAYREALFAQDMPEREMMERETEKKYGALLDKFLSALGPYLLLPAAHKVLEFLIRQYKVHQYNVVGLLGAALPYHDTALWAGLVQLPCSTAGTVFSFIGKKREGLSRPQLERVCCSDLSVLEVVSKLVKGNPYDRLVRFWAVLACGVIVKKQRAAVDSLFPRVVACLKSKDEETIQAGCLLACQLAKHGSLSDKACQLLILSCRKSAKRGSKRILAACLQCAAQVFFYNSVEVDLPRGFVEYVVKKCGTLDTLVSAFVQAFSERPTDSPSVKFLGAWYKELAVENHWNELHRLARSCVLAQPSELFVYLAQRFSSDDDKGKKGAAARKHIQDTANLLAEVCAPALERLLFSKSHDKQCWQLAASAFAGTDLECVEIEAGESDGKLATLRMALAHSLASVRAQALDQLGKRSQGAQEFWQQNEQLVLDRMYDDSDEVCAAALEATFRQSDHLTMYTVRGESRSRLLGALVAALSNHGATNPMVLQHCKQLFSVFFAAQLGLVFDEGEGQLDLSAEDIDAALIQLGWFGNSGSGKKKQREQALLPSEYLRDPQVLLLLAKRALESESAARVCAKLIAAIAECPSPPKVLLANAFQLGMSPRVWGPHKHQQEDVYQADIIKSLGQIVQANPVAVEAGHFGSGWTASKDVPTGIVLLSIVLNATEQAFCQCIDIIGALLEKSAKCVLRVLLFVASGGSRISSGFTAVDGPGRQRALQLMTTLMQSQARSFLNLLPFLVGPLTDKYPAARRAALACVEQVHRSHQKARKSDHQYFNGGKDSAEQFASVVLSKAWPTAALALVDRILEARGEIEQDPLAVAKIFRTLHSPDAVDAILQQATALVVDVQKRESGKVFSEMIECMVRPVQFAPASDLKSTGPLALAAAKASARTLFDVATSSWVHPDCSVDGKTVVACLDPDLSWKTRQVSTREWLPGIFPRLSKSEQKTALKYLLETLTREENPAMRREAQAVLRNIPLSGTLLAHMADELLGHPHRRVAESNLVDFLEVCRARLFLTVAQSNDPQVSSPASPKSKRPSEHDQIPRALLAPLLKALSESKDVQLPLLPICLERCLFLCLQTPSTVADMQGVKIEIVVERILQSTNTPFRTACLQLLATACQLFTVAQVVPKLIPVLRMCGDCEDSPFVYLVLENVTRGLQASLGRSRSTKKQISSASKRKNKSKAVATTTTTAATVHANGMDLNLMHDVCEMYVQTCYSFANTARAVHILEMLAKSLDALPEVIRVLCSESSATQTELNKEQRLWFAQEIVPKFPILQQVEAFSALVEQIDQLPGGEKDAVVVCHFLSETLGSGTFRSQLAAQHPQTQQQMQQQRAHPNGLEEPFLALVTHLHKQISAHGQEADAVREALSTVLDRITARLGVQLFVPVIKGLMLDPDDYVRNMALRQLAVKFELQRKHWSVAEELLFLEMVTTLASILGDRAESDVNKQTALLSLDIIAKYLGPKAAYAHQFVALLPALVEMLDSDKELASSVCLCLGTLIKVLRHGALKSLPKFGPKVISLFLRCYNSDEPSSSLLAQSAASTIFSMVSHLAQFLTPYLPDLLRIVAQAQRSELAPLIRMTTQRCGEEIAKNVEPRLLTNQLRVVMLEMIQQQDMAGARNLIRVLDASVQEMPKEVLATQVVALSNLFRDMLCVRAGLSTNMDVDTEDDVLHFEQKLAESYLELAMLFSGSQMRKSFGILSALKVSSDQNGQQQDQVGADLFASVLSDKDNTSSNKRATSCLEQKLSPSSSSSSLTKAAQAATLYMIVEAIGEKFQSLAIPFLQRLIQPLLDDLNRSSEDFVALIMNSDVAPPPPKKKKKKSRKATDDAEPEGNNDQKYLGLERIIRRRALRILALFCEHGGRDKIVDDKGNPTELFSELLDALVACINIDHVTITGEDGCGESSQDGEFYLEFMESRVVPAIVQLAKATGEESSWQTLHHAVLQLSEHASPNVRVGVARMISTLFDQVGESYLMLLADTLPRIAELLSDKEQRVRFAAQRAAKKLQQLSGEDLDSFLQH